MNAYEVDQLVASFGLPDDFGINLLGGGMFGFALAVIFLFYCGWRK